MYVVENQYEPEDEFKISDQDIRSAFSTLKLRSTIFLTAKMKSKLNKTREKISRRKTLMNEDVDKNNPLPTMQLTQEDSCPKQSAQ